MDKLILMGLLLSVSGFSSAAAYSITCENAVVTKEDGSTYPVKQTSLSSDSQKSILKVDDHPSDLPPVTNLFGGYITSTTDENGIKLTVTATDGITPHTAALVVSVEDVNGNVIWGLVAGGCKSHKTK